MKPEEFFQSKRQLNRYKYAVELVEKIISLQNEGCLIFDEFLEVVKGRFVVEKSPHGHTDWLVAIRDDTTHYGVVECWYNDDDTPYVGSKREIKEAFDEYKCVHPKNIKLCTR